MSTWVRILINIPEQAGRRNYGSCHSDAAFQHTARTLAGVWLPSPHTPAPFIGIVPNRWWSGAGHQSSHSAPSGPSKYLIIPKKCGILRG